MDLYRKIGIDPPRGVLLYGPPGKLDVISDRVQAYVQVRERQCWSRLLQTPPPLLSSASSVQNSFKSTWER